MVKSTLLNPVKLDILCQLRESAGLTQRQAARLCGLTSKQGRVSLGAWEQGKRIPHTTRRPQIIAYLWDHLGLRKDPAQFEKVWTIFVEEWGWEPIGDREWARFTRVERPNSRSSGNGTTPSDSEHHRPLQVPTGIPHFVGREEELTATSRLLTADDGPSTVAFVGMGGIGKTTLAIHVAHALRSHFTDGILWATAAITNPLDIAQSWATAYGYDFSGLSDLESRAAAIRNVLAEKHALIVFDDVIDAADVRPLLPSSKESGDSCRVLITTRNHDIASTLNAHLIAPTELATQTSIDLLISVLGASRVEAEFAAAERICQIVEGLPLAVEIVAQRLLSRPQQSLENMVTRLEDSSQRLGLEISDRAIRAAFEVSWAQLNDEQKEVFSQMGVFEGRSFAIPALAYIGERSEAETEDLVWELQALSLVGADGDGRYRQHPLLADFAGERLGGGDNFYQRLAEYYFIFAQIYQDDHSHLDSEWNGIMLGMEKAYQLGQSSLVIDYADTLTLPWFKRGEYTRARQGYQLAAEVAHFQKNQNRLSWFLLRWGLACLEQDRQEEALEKLNISLQNFLCLEDEVGIAEASYGLGRLAAEQRDYEHAEKLLNTSCQTFRTCGDIAGEIKTQYQRAWIAYSVSNFASALAISQDIVTLAGANTSPCIVPTLRLLIDISIEEGELEQAKYYGEQALSICRKHQDKNELAATYYSLAVVYRYLNSTANAIRSIEQATSLFNNIGDLKFQAVTLYEKSKISLQIDQLSEAQGAVYKSLSIYEYLNDDYCLVFALDQLGDVLEKQGNLQEAYLHWSAALEIALPQNHMRCTDLRNKLS